VRPTPVSRRAQAVVSFRPIREFATRWSTAWSNVLTAFRPSRLPNRELAPFRLSASSEP
jgi:hypothetical protein